MLRFFLILLCCLVFDINSAKAKMPIYDASDYYYQCLEVNRDPEACAKQDNSRILNDIKKQYRVILTSPNLVGWHDNITENTNTMRDMYESWTAYRTRLCSLSHKSAQYLEKLIPEKISCTMYYEQHHQDHLDKVIRLLTKQVPENKMQFGYLYIEEHDNKYAECRKNKESGCIEAELLRTTKDIKNLYKTMSEDEYLGKWNNGPDLKNGNFRDLYDSWIAYRNRLCSLSVWAYKVGYGPKAMSSDYCLLYFNIENFDALKNILVSAHSTLDEEMVTDDDDGGDAEGKTIQPLQRRFDAPNDDEDLSDDSEAKPEETNSEKELPKKNLNVPTWAR